MRILGGLDYMVSNHADMDVTRTARTFSSDPKFIKNLRHTFDLNFFSHVKLLADAMPHLKKSDGRVAVISSLKGKYVKLH